MNKKILIIGFIFGAVVLPFIYVLGLILPIPESFRFLVPGFDVASKIVELEQIGPDTYRVPAIQWILSELINGGLWVFIFWGISKLYKIKRHE